MKQEGFFKKNVIKSIKKKGILLSFLSGIKFFLGYYYYKLFKSWSNFSLHKTKLKYFYYPYNATWKNERAVEIPIIFNVLKKYRGKRILEVGNVLSYYFSVNHDILDKYEKAKGLINEDVVYFKSNKKYDLIISISTLEHVGETETPRESKKILKAIANLKKCLNKNGKMVVTMPLGYNNEMDKMIKTGEIKFDKQYFLKRISKDNRWKEISLKDMKNIKYNKPFPFANGLFVGVIEK